MFHQFCRHVHWLAAFLSYVRSKGPISVKYHLHATSDMTNLPYSFFKDRFEFFIRHIDLAVVVPKLRARDQLTDEEYETVDFMMTPKITRKRQLANILYGKPAWVPWIVLECLRDQSDSSPPDNHVLLADELERYLQEWPEGPQQFMPLTRERSFEKQHSSGEQCVTRERSFEKQPSSEEQCVTDPLHALYTTNQQYRNLLRGISSELNQQGFGREHIALILDSMCKDGNLFLQLPPNVTDFASLMVFLHNRGLSHEYDTDFLCEILKLVPAPELREEVVAYSNSLGDINVLQCNNMHWSVLPSSDHFVAFTFHTLPSMTLGQALGVKDFLAFYLGIPRYSFSLRRAEEGSVVLAWQFCVKFLEHFYKKCDGEKLQTILDGEEKAEMKNIQKVEVQVDSKGERMVVLNRAQGLKRQRSDEVSSTTVSSTTGEEYSAKVTKIDTSEELRQRGRFACMHGPVIGV